MIDLGLGDDQRQMVEGAIGLLREHSPVARLRPGATPSDAHGELAAWGWFGAGLPEAQGGLGLGIAEEALLFFEAGRFLLSPTVLATAVAARLCAGERLAGLPEGLLDGRTQAAAALADAGGAYAFDRDGASLLVVFDADEVWLAPAEAFDGATVASLDEALVTERGAVDRSRRLAGEPAGRAHLLACAMLAGIARASCDLAVEYASVREQFGQPIGAFQAIKHMCADMDLRAYAAEAQLRMAASAAADAPHMAAFQLHAAVHTALRAARGNASDAIQVHGGIGFTAECDAHFYLKRAHVLGRLVGGPEACRDRVLAGAASGAA